MVKKTRIFAKKPGYKIRPSRELIKIINYVKARALLEGKRMPSVNRVTEIIASKIKKEDIYEECV